MSNAFALGGYTMTAIAETVGLSVSRVSRLIGKVEGMARGKM
jgi:AraC-like DNA-binding protein